MRQDESVPGDIAPDGADPPFSAARGAAAVARRESSDRREPSCRREPSYRGEIEAEVRQRIGRNLRLLYADLLSEPLPERFANLVADLATRRETS